MTQGDEYNFVVESRNVFGYSQVTSNQVTILQAQVPDAPISLENIVATTERTQIGINWSPGTFDGASPVIDYTVLFDQGTGTWIEHNSGITSATYTATGLTADTVYSFKVKARNIVGFSLESASISIRAATVPL